MRKPLGPITLLSALLAFGCGPSNAPSPAKAPPSPPPEAAAQLTRPPRPADREPAREVAPKPPDLLALPHEDAPGVEHLAAARGLLGDGELELALRELRWALLHAPRDGETLALLGQAARRARQWNLAAEAYGRLAEEETSDAAPLIQRARALVARGDWEAAIEAAEAAVGRDPGHPEAYQALGRAHLSRGDVAAAITSFERVIALAPGHAHALNNLGLSYLRASRAEDAVGVLVRAAALLPEVAYVHNNLGVALERTGQLDEAEYAYREATRLSPRYLKARLNSERLSKKVAHLLFDLPPGDEEEPRD